MMSQNQIRRIPVIDNDKIVGILTLGGFSSKRKCKYTRTFVIPLRIFVVITQKTQNNLHFPKEAPTRS